MPTTGSKTVDIAELRRLLAASAPGPWLVGEGGDHSGLGNYIVDGDGDVVVAQYGDGASLFEVDRDLIVAMRNALPNLLDELEELRAKD